MTLEESDGEAVWRLSEDPVLSSSQLARRIVGQVKEFGEQYGISLLTGRY
jgi:hypothetical protein